MTETAPSTPAATPKVDPETLVIRGQLPRSIRFRRGLIIGGSAAASVALMSVTWLALKPVSFRRVAEGTELSEPATRSSEALERAPATYAQVPKLGPPLPGDLGRPILEHDRAISSTAGHPVTPVPAVQQGEMVDRQRKADALRTAHESPVLVPSRGGPQPAVAAATSLPTSDAAALSPVPIPAAADPNQQQRKQDFMMALDPNSGTNPHRLTAASSSYVLAAGSVISASLITGLRSDLPGIVTAQVTEPVYDSPTGETLLIPQGARLIGSYDSVVAFGQRRALIVWQRILLPDGASLRLDNAPAADPSGYAGLADKVDFHSWALLKGIVLSTLLGAGSELALRGDGDLVDAVRRSTQDTVSRAGDRITERNLNVQPTITVRPGARVRLVVNKDLILEPWRSS